MPRYDYRCTECGQTFEVSKSMTDRSDETCPACGKPAARVFAPVGVAFKGTGFHNTDYKPRPAENTGGDSAPACASASPSCAGCPAAE